MPPVTTVELVRVSAQDSLLRGELVEVVRSVRAAGILAVRAQAGSLCYAEGQIAYLNFDDVASPWGGPIGTDTEDLQSLAWEVIRHGRTRTSAMTCALFLKRNVGLLRHSPYLLRYIEETMRAELRRVAELAQGGCQ